MADRAELEAAIFADPDAREPYAVYADWLLEQGDRDGELINVQLALEDRFDPTLTAREAELIAEREERLKSLYYYAVGKSISPTWRRGVLHAATICGDWYSNETAYAYRELLADPVSRFIREVTLFPATSIGGRPEPDDRALVDAIAELGVPPALRRLVFEPIDFQISWSRLTDPTSIYPHLRSLRELAISAGDVTLGQIDLPDLRSFSLITGGLRAHALESVVTARWPRLESLSLYLGGDGYGGEITLPMLAPILDGAVVPPGVTTLGLCNCAFGDELVEGLARSLILPRLTRLDLYDSTIGDDGARTILQHADAFRHLAKLDLRWNYLTSTHRSALAGLGPEVVFGDQRVPEDGERYAGLGE